MLPPPANDNFANAIDLGSALSGMVTGSNVRATIEASESGHRSIWYKWTAPVDGPHVVSFETIGSVTEADPGIDLDTVLTIYSGSALGALSFVTADDDLLGTPNSRVHLAGNPGTTYRIQVAGKTDADIGDTVLRWRTMPLPLTTPRITFWDDPNVPAAGEYTLHFKAEGFPSYGVPTIFGINIPCEPDVGFTVDVPIPGTSFEDVNPFLVSNYLMSGSSTGTPSEFTGVLTIGDMESWWGTENTLTVGQALDPFSSIGFAAFDPGISPDSSTFDTLVSFRLTALADRAPRMRPGGIIPIRSVS